MLTRKGFIIFKYFKNFSPSNSNKHQYTYSTHKQYFLKKAHVLACSVMSDSLQLGGLYPSRLLCPWIFTKVDSHSFLQGTVSDPGSNLCLLHWQVNSLRI